MNRLLTPEENQWSGEYRQPGALFHVANFLWMSDGVAGKTMPDRQHWRSAQFEMDGRGVDRRD